MSLVILYGTQTGTAEQVAFRVARLALKRGIPRVRCLPADEVPVERWYDMTYEYGDEPYSCALFIVSNANQGDAPESFRKSWLRLLSESEPSLKLRRLRYAVFGLGDSIYAKFNYTAKLLHNRLQRLNCEPLLLRGLGDESDAKGIDEALLPWLMKLWTALGCTILPGDVTENPLEAPIFPLYKVVQVSRQGEVVEGDAGGGSAGSSQEESVLLDSFASMPPHSTFTCEVISNQRLTAPDHFQAVHHIELKPHLPSPNVAGGDLDDGGLCYEVGDALGVYCPNRPAIVEEMLQRLRLSGEEVLHITPETSHGLIQQSARPFFHRPMTSRALLTHYVDLEAIVKHEFFWMLSFFVEKRVPFEDKCHPPSCFDASKMWSASSKSKDEVESEAAEQVGEVRERLLELANPLNVDEYLQYAHREKRNICEVLHDFNMPNSMTCVEPPLAYVLTFLTPMHPRYFSLSSSPAMDGRQRLNLTVAQLTWQTPMKRHRSGLCSTYLVESKAADKLTCVLWQGTLSTSPVPHPLLCIATGTGIAPIRSLIRQCAAAEDLAWADTPIYLFFGCRNKEKDFLYNNEWKELWESGRLRQLHVIPAFSRDTAKKVYVQHQLGQHAKLVNTLLLHKEAIAYVCGNAKQMPKDVQSTLEHIIATCSFDGDEFKAAQTIKEITKLGRYQVDTWSA
ncbi:unnamed protein product [Phytomonas sp. EM1]|nr:unnamed protein product [Phytomonas sp. EM1]|eukprot:CCW60670.1 unnamed protein product [Phytomonas sp. isolate EM1]